MVSSSSYAYRLIFVFWSLGQEDGMDQKLSVFHLFSELFPEYANDKDRDGGNTGTVCLYCQSVAHAISQSGGLTGGE